MLRVDRDILTRVRSSNISVTELSQYLLSTFPVTEIAMELARYILKQGAGGWTSSSIIFRHYGHIQDATVVKEITTKAL